MVQDTEQGSQKHGSTMWQTDLCNVDGRWTTWTSNASCVYMERYVDFATV